jgi:hypothetical protein
VFARKRGQRGAVPSLRSRAVPRFNTGEISCPKDRERRELSLQALFAFFTDGMLAANSSQGIYRCFLKIKDLSQRTLPVQWNAYCIRQIRISNGLSLRRSMSTSEKRKVATYVSYGLLFLAIFVLVATAYIVWFS